MKTTIIRISANMFSMIRKITTIVFLGLITMATQAQTASFTLDTVVARPGEDITVSVYANNLNDVGAITLYLSYSGSTLTYLGADNWHPLFDNGYNLANGLGNQAGIVWFDTAGVSATNLRMLDLHFHYNGGVTALSFTSNCEIANSLGTVISPAPLYQQGLVVPEVSAVFSPSQRYVCPGVNITLSPTISGGYGGFTYQWSASSGGFSATTSSISVSPSTPTTYTVTVSSGNTSDTASVRVNLYTDPSPTAVSGMLPIDSATGLDNSVNLSWFPGQFSTLYDVYLWKEGSPVPSNPKAANLTQINYQASSLEYETRYFWRIVSKNNCYEISGPVQSFTTVALPELHIVSMNHSLSKSGQAIQVTWTVRNDGNGPTTTPTWYDRVWISPDIDLRIGETEDILLGTYTNTTALAPGQSYTQTKTIALPQNFIGTYFLFVVTDVIDAILSFDPNAVFPNPYNPPPYLTAYSHGGAGVNLVKEPNDSPPYYDNFFYKEISFPVPPLPDLIVTQVAAPVSTFSGQSISVNWSVKNAGNASTGIANWIDKIYLSTDSTLDNGDAYLGELAYNGILNPDSTYGTGKGFTIPNFIQGTYYAIVHTDASNYIFEHAFDQNNTDVSGPIDVILTPPPDLVVTSVLAPDTISNAQKFLLKWSVSNLGATGPVTKSWYDAVYISSSATFEDPSKVYLGKLKQTVQTFAPGSFYPAQLEVTVPAGISGPYYFYVHTDFENNVFEYQSDTNNSKRSFAPTMVMSPDLSPSNLSFTPLNLDGKTFPASWTINNNGPGNLQNQSWTEHLYISTTPIYQQGFSLQVGSKSLNSNIDAGLSHLTSDSIRLPNTIAEGTYFVHVLSDASNQIFENNQESNNLLAVPTALSILRADMLVSSVSHSDTASSGQPMLVEWYDKNEGSGVVSGKWMDRVYLSAYSTYNPSTVTLLGEYSNSGTIGAGDSLSQMRAVTLPNGISGQFYLFVSTDVNNTIPEGGRDNNNRTLSPISLYIDLSPFADLVPDTIYCPDTVSAGVFVDLGFRITNIGSIIAQGAAWTDRLLIGNHSNPSIGTSTSLKTFTRNLPLEPDSSYELHAGIQIPTNLTAGQYYIIGKTDEQNYVYEYTGEANNTRGKRLYVKPYPLDLAAISASFASDTLNSGQTLNVGWTVRNISSVKTLANSWEDAIYLSTDTIFNAGSDLLLTYRNVSGPIIAGADYSQSQAPSIPYGYNGNYYVFVKVDNKLVTRDVNTPNNIVLCRDGNGTPKPIYINELPSPDLIVSYLEVPAQLYSGQAYKLKWTVTNQGLGAANSSWVDAFYLSTDFAINNGDKLIGSKIHNQPLAPGTSYTDSLELTTLFTTDINYILIARTDNMDLVTEYNAEANNTASVFTAASVPPPADLIVTSIVLPDTLIVGSTVSIDWTVSNIGSNRAYGLCDDGFYISSDTILDNDDLFFANWNGSINIDPAGSLVHSMLATVPGLAKGYYYIITVADIKNTINEINDTNNYYASEAVFISLPVMPMNTHITESLDNMNYLYYWIDIPDSLIGETILIELKGDSITGNNEMFVARDRVPSKIDYDRKQTYYFKGNQELVIPEVVAGDYYLMVTGITSTGTTQPIDLIARKVHFEVRSYDPSEGGNTGSVTMQIYGSKFTPDMEVWLNNDTIQYFPWIQAPIIHYVDASQVFATFKLLNGPYTDDFSRDPVDIGLYNLVLIKPGTDTLIIPNAFRVVEGSERRLLLDIFYPPSVRWNRFVTMSIQFANGSNVDINAPKAALLSMFGAPIGLAMDDLQYNLTDLELEFVDPSGPPGILRPGTYWTITIYTKSTQRLLFKLLQIE